MAITRSLKKTGILLWKNCLLIFRRPVSLAGEILIPLNLYVAILVLRALFPPDYYQDQLFRPMALPSAGLLPFTQTLICDLSTNGANNNYSSDMPVFPDANVTKLYSLLGDSSINDIGVSFCQSLADIQSIGTCQDPLLDKLTNSDNGQDLKFGDLLSDEQSFRLFLSNDLHLNNSVIDNILNANVDIEQSSGSLAVLFLQNVLGSNGGDFINNLDGTKLRLLLCDDPFLDSFIKFSSSEAKQQVTSSLCNLTDSQFDQLADELQTQLQSHCNDLLSPDNLQKIAVLFDILSLLPSDINQGGPSDIEGIYRLAHGFMCGSLPVEYPPTDLLLLGSHILYGDFYQKDRLIANLTEYPDRIAPKILYSPNTTVTQSIMSYANITFEAVQILLDTLVLIDNCSSSFVTDNPPDSDLITQLDNYINNPLVNTLSGVSQNTVSQLQELLQDGSSNNIWNRTVVLHDNIVLIEEYINLVDWDVFYPVDTEEEMINISFNKDRQFDLGISSVFAGVVFDEGINEIPLKNVSMKIRMNSTYVHDTELLKEPVWFEGPEGDLVWQRRYLGGGFVFLQDMIERALIDEIIGDRVATPGGYVHQLPYHCYKNDLFLVGIQYLLPLLMSLGWMLSVAMIVRGVVREKDSRMKEVMRMMGLGRGQLWGSWFITSFCTLLVSVIFITVSLKYGGFFTHTNGLLLFVYLTTYAIAVIMYCFLVSLFFTNANMAACVAAVVYFLFFFVQIVILNKLALIPVGAVMLMCVMLPVAFALGCTMIVQFELQLVGQQFDNMFTATFPESNFSFGMVFIMLIVDIFLYGILIWYIEAVFPGKYGVSKPWYFPAQPLIDLYHRFRSRHRDGHYSEDRELLFKADEDDGPVYEEYPEGLPEGIVIQGLTKTYRVGCNKQIKALKQLNLNLYEGQITAFLGHNGAGKTTTMSLLTGLYEPTKGTALIYGMDIKDDMDKIRNCLGMCPQHNVLFDDLTVEEHLLFFAQMKNSNYKEARRQIPIWLDKVGLQSHQKALTRHLSGGMKRKLSILLAFVGNSKTIILDEPTSGVDPYARTQIWDFISQLKDGRTIMLSTHHMDEAEVLGDRIAIINKGNLLCTGSFEFLKGRFGRGHHLTVVIDKMSRDPLSGQEDEDTDGNNTGQITNYLKQHIPDVSLVEKRGWELNYLLPLRQSRPMILKELFQGIDSDQSDLGIQHYGMTSCSMEEIFIELTQKEIDDSDEHNTRGDQPQDEGTFPQRTLLPRGSATSFDIDGNDKTDGDNNELINDSDDSHDASVAMVTGIRLVLYQYCALLVKRFHHTRRNPKAFFVQNVLPLFVVGGCLAIAHSVLNVYDPPNLRMHPSMFFEFTPDNYMFVAQNNTKASRDYDNTLYRPCGIGAKYIDYSNNPQSICYADTPPDSCHGYPTTLGQCDCENCSRTHITHDTPTCYNGTVTGTRILNMSDYSYEELSSYLLSTARTFIEERYGGVSFGHKRSDIPITIDNRYNNNGNNTDPIIALQEGAKAWFSYKGFHSVPSYLNTMNNAILRANLPLDNITTYGISTFSHPFPTTVIEKLESAKNGGSFLINPLAVMFGLGFVVAAYVLIIIEERSSNFLHLQQVCGLDRLAYWLSTYTWDFINYIAVCVLILIMYAIAKDDNFNSVDLLFSMFLVLLSYGVAMIPWTYVYSYLFQSPRTAYVVLFCLNFFSGLLLLIVVAVVVALAFDFQDSNFSYWLCILPMPGYIVARAMMYFTLDRVEDEVVLTISQQGLSHPLVDLWPYILAMVLHGVLATVILIIIQLFQYRTNFHKKFNTPKVLINEDKDVSAERRRVSDRDGIQQCPLVLDNLTKVYKSTRMTMGGCRGRSLTAVNQLSISLQQAECFGLLGLNGAGKTSTFKMITGDIKSTSGDATVNGISVNKSVARARRSIGYCPQFDALSDSLTGREHLVLICKLRGIPPKGIKQTVDNAISRLELDAHANKPVYSYSGGNMRRLSTAIALIANPPVLLLDEPTSGVDPRARQFLWKTIKNIANNKHAVLLTTHNMAECETLCSRIGILVNGELKCIGSPQELKSKFGKGYTLKLRIQLEKREDTKTFLQESFPSVVLKEEHHNSLMYGLPPGLSLSTVYHTIESVRAQLDIEDYSLNQTTLDDVFIHFVKEQREEGVSNHTHDEATLPDNSGLELRLTIDDTSNDTNEVMDDIIIDDTINKPTETTQL